MLKRLIRFVFAEELALQFGVARHVTSQLQRAYRYYNPCSEILDGSLILASITSN